MGFNSAFKELNYLHVAEPFLSILFAPTCNKFNLTCNPKRHYCVQEPASITFWCIVLFITLHSNRFYSPVFLHVSSFLSVLRMKLCTKLSSMLCYVCLSFFKCPDLILKHNEVRNNNNNYYYHYYYYAGCYTVKI